MADRVIQNGQAKPLSGERGVLSRTVVLLFAVFALLVVATVTLNYLTSSMVSGIERDSMETHLLIDHLRDCESTIKDAETGQRGFLITGDPQYLEPYHHALSEISDNFTVLDGYARSGRIKNDDLARLKQLTQTKLDELTDTVDLKQKHQDEKAVAIVQTDFGLAAMNRISSHVAGMIQILENDLAAARRSALRMDRWRMGLLIFTTAANLAFLGWASGRLRREIVAREASTLETRRQKDLLAVTLGSIGDAVIVTDSEGSITFMNQIAVELTGWSMPDATGMPLAQVFKIINEQTRKPVDSPVEKVLQLGVIVGLANHTLLVRRDGSEVPIDDSGAPIRDPDGAIRGVVLIFRDFTEHKQAERRLQDAKAEVEAASRAKDYFMATLSHELRTPLTPIMATLDGWESGGEVPPALAEDVKLIRRNIALEARLIDDLLDLNRIVRGRLPLKLDVVDVHELVNAVAMICRGEARAKQIDLSLRLDAEQHHARADAARLQQVFWNVLKNAIKFTPEMGHVLISTANRSQGTIEITVSDDGIGMNDETISRVFSPFEQATEEISRRFGGLGLGLSISRGLVQMQQGSITASSVGLGKGSTIQVQFPTVAAPVPAPVQPPSNGAARPAGRPLNILLVEDHVDTAQVMSRLLRRLGHMVRTSGTVQEAAEMARNDEYDVLLSDIGLPDGSGIDLLRQIRQHRNVPAIALTGYGMEDDLARCMEAGFWAHLTKPIDFQNLEQLLERLPGD